MPPGRFEAGTGNIADAVGLGAAIDYLGRIGMEKIAAHEQGLIAYATKLLRDVPGLRIIGTAAEKAGVISFVLDGKESEGSGRGAQSGRHRGAVGPSLRAADPAPLWARKHGAPVFRALQHLRRYRRAGRGLAPDSERA